MAESPSSPLTMTDIEEANKAAGLHFFDRDSMKFFSSTVIAGPFGRYFVTRERAGFDHGSSMRYTIRYANKDGTIDNIGDFLQYASSAGAISEARALAAMGN